MNKRGRGRRKKRGRGEGKERKGKGKRRSKYERMGERQEKESVYIRKEFEKKER